MEAFRDVGGRYEQFFIYAGFPDGSFHGARYDTNDGQTLLIRVRDASTNYSCLSARTHKTRTANE